MDFIWVTSLLSSLNAFVHLHDLRLAAWAAVVCLVATYGGLKLLLNARRHRGRVRAVWTGVTALLIGLGIWATHFIGLLAWHPGFALSFTPRLLDASLLTAIAVSGLGIAIAVRGRGARAHFLGGATIGIAIACMHYIGTAAIVLGGSIGWNVSLVAVSILTGMALGGLSFVAAMRGHMTAAAALLALAICGTHSSAMFAADFSRSFPLPSADKITSDMLSVGVTVISLLITAIAVGGMVLDEADRRHAERERQRQLADAEHIDEVTTLLEVATTHMAQGLCLFDSAGHLQFHNVRVAELIGDVAAGQNLMGRHFRDLLAALQNASDSVEQNSPAELEQRADELMAKIGNGETTDYFRTMNDGRIIRFVHSAIADGGWVTTLDDVTVQQRTQAEVSRLAYRDSLTNILNRAAFNEKLDSVLERAAVSDLNFAVIAIDLDRFKEINDTYGHAIGDQVLKALGTRLSTGLKDGETVARLGGDEFAALKAFTSMDSLRDFLARIESALFARITTDQVTINTAASIGVAIYPDDGGDRSRLLNNADLAMYRAKTEFERRVCYYEEDMDEHARQRRSMAQDLWVALENDGFHLVYQVQKSVATNMTTGYEVLLRWNRPGHGLVPPSDFIPIAEESGAISAIGAWVLRTACTHAVAWPETYKIAVNVSGVQLGQIELIETVRDVLLETGLSPSRLELEVTETSIIADKQRALHILRQIKAMGVSIAIDDFGTGYSSLDTLRSFPFDKIKIDRSFLAEVDLNDQSKAIVRAILALGRSLSVPVLAEGVETLAQLEVLRAEGCNEAQGYLLGRPGFIDWTEAVEPLKRQERH